MPVGISQVLNWGNPWQVGGTITPLTTATTATISPQGTGPVDFNVGTQYLYYGATLRLFASGFLTTTATSTTATIFAAAGATPTTLCTPPGITTGTTVLSQLQWAWESWHTVTGIASSGNTISSFGRLQLYSQGAAVPANPSALTALSGLHLPAPATGGDTLAAVNTAAAMPIMLRGTLAGANATIQCNRFIVEHLYA